MGNETQALEERVRRLEAQVKTLLARRDDDERYRVGYGCDLHRFTEGSSLRLGGIVIPYCQSLLGHSDADALLHAIADAILGAAGVGDIGELFPDTAEENRDRDSAEILMICVEEALKRGWQVVNLDCVVCAQRPKLGPLKKAMRARNAAILDVPEDRVNVKAKTGEHVGPVGRLEAIETFATVLMTRVAREKERDE